MNPALNVLKAAASLWERRLDDLGGPGSRRLNLIVDIYSCILFPPKRKSEERGGRSSVCLSPERLCHFRRLVTDRDKVRKPGLLPVRVNVLSHRSVLSVGHQLPKATRTHTGYRMFDAQITRHMAFVQKGNAVRLTLKDTKRVLKLPVKAREIAEALLRVTALPYA